ncbi:MAG: hypothetical protein D6690_04920 [Nitrospirae bacterium]|nr:MAG: hypothetical protein D6690_04920 [Nitrospirota bacterium]
MAGFARIETRSEFLYRRAISLAISVRIRSLFWRKITNYAHFYQNCMAQLLLSLKSCVFKKFYRCF